MANPQWPAVEKRQHLGKPYDRLDGAIKSTGRAKYAYDVNRPGMLWARCIGSPHAAAKVVDIDGTDALAVPGVEGFWRDEGVIGKEVEYAGQIIAAIAATSEELAAEAMHRVKITYEKMEHQVVDNDISFAKGRPASRDEGDVEIALGEAATISEGHYGIAAITHCCLEAHGQVAEVRDGAMYIWPSTQNVSKYADGLNESVDSPLSDIHVDCQYMGGGFGSKFGHDKWGMIGCILAKQTGKPVKIMLERDLELMVAGNRPSAFGTVKVGLDGEGKIHAFDAQVWGTGGGGGYRPPPMPYAFTKLPNQRVAGSRIPTNRGSQRAWRAPGHPQGCLITMAALADAAAAMGMDELEVFKKNLEYTEHPETYAEELDIAAEMIGYKDKAHLRSALTDGPVKRGLGVSIHQWGGMGHPSECDVTIHPDGSVEAKIGSQDLGTATRTSITIVLAETVGLPMDAVKVKMGKNAYPVSGASGGSTTIGGVSASTRLAATNALNALLEVAAPRLGVAVDALEAAEGTIRETANPSNAMTWTEACGLLGVSPITKRGENVAGESQKMGLIDQGVGGVQIADVSVDVETGVVTINEMVAVQDCGLIVNMKTAESQVYGGLIMGVTYALFEECVYDAATGRMLNPDMEFYRLAGLYDVGNLKVHMMTGPRYDSRGVIGLGEPPVISPGAAISNAVANAIGVRVPELPLTPERVLNALGGTA